VRNRAPPEPPPEPDHAPPPRALHQPAAQSPMDWPRAARSRIAPPRPARGPRSSAHRPHPGPSGPERSGLSNPRRRPERPAHLLAPQRRDHILWLIPRLAGHDQSPRAMPRKGRDAQKAHAFTARSTA
jgi:hypothetical protein